MDSVNMNPMQQQVSVAVSEGHRLEPPPDRHPLVMIPTPNRILTGEEVQPKTSQSMVTSGTSSLYQYHHGTLASNPPPAVANGTHQNPTVSSSFGARMIPSSMTTFSRPHTDQNFSLTHFNLYANQGLTSTSYGPQIDPKVNSISSRPHTNCHDTFPYGIKHEPVPLAPMSRPHDYCVNTSNNTNGTRFPVSTISPPTAGVGSSSTAAVHGASTYPPTRNFYIPAYPHPQQLPESWSFQQQRIPSIYEDQLQKYICHWNRRPKDNNITFWREFVNEYYAPDGKRKCCLSAWTDYITTKYRKWKDKSPCDHCRTYSQYGYDISFEELPIYFQYKFNTLKSETMKLGAFQELRLENKNTVLYFAEVSEEAMDNHFLTVQEGPLAVTFTVDNKILSWQFCVRNCEKLAARSDLQSRVNEMLRNAGDSSGASGSKSDQQWTKENCSMIIKTGCELAKKLKANKFHEIGRSTQDVQTNMINKLPNTMMNSMDINFRNQYGTDSLQNCTAHKQSWGHQIESQSLSSIISQSLGANKKQVNLRVPQLLHPPSVLDTSTASCRLGTCTESSSRNSNGTTNPLCMCMASTVNASSMSGPSDPTVNLLKRAGTTENGFGTDALLGQRVTRQHLGSGDWNLTASLVVDQNMGSSANILEASRESEDRQVDYILEGTDLDNYLTDIAILEDILK